MPYRGGVGEKREPWADGIKLGYLEADPPYVPAVQVGRFLVPGRMSATIEHPSLPVNLELALEVDYATRAVQCSRLSCTDRSTAKGVTGQKLRRLPVERIIRSVLHAAASDNEGRPLDWTAAEEDFSAALTVGNPTARWALTPEHLQGVARVYREAVANRNRAPVEEVAAHFGRLRGRKVPRATAARWVQKAREGGRYLGETSQGRIEKQDREAGK